MIRWWLLLAAAGVAVSACSPGRASQARSPSRPVAAATVPGTHAAAPGNRGIPALGGRVGSATLPQVTYPSLGINLSAGPPAAPGKLAPDAVSPAVVLAGLKAHGAAALPAGSALRAERPAIVLRTITELHPTARGVRPRVPYPGWVVIYRHVQLVSYGLHPLAKDARGTFVAIMDAATGWWTDFFTYGSARLRQCPLTQARAQVQWQGRPRGEHRMAGCGR